MIIVQVALLQWEKSKRCEAMGWECCIRHGYLDLNVQFLFQISISFFTVHDSLWWTLYRCVFRNGGKAWAEWAVGVLYQSFLTSKINNFFLHSSCIEYCWGVFDKYSSSCGSDIYWRCISKKAVNDTLQEPYLPRWQYLMANKTYHNNQLCTIIDELTWK